MFSPGEPIQASHLAFRADAPSQHDGQTRTHGSTRISTSSPTANQVQHMFETVVDSETFCYAPEDVVDADDASRQLTRRTGFLQLSTTRPSCGSGATAFRFLRPSIADAAGASSRPSVSIPTAPRSSTFGFSNALTASRGSSLVSRTPTTSRRSLRVSLATRSVEKASLRSGTWFCRTTRAPKSARQTTSGAIRSFYTAMRLAHCEKRVDQSRALREASLMTDDWSSKIHLTWDSVLRGLFRERRVVGNTSSHHLRQHGRHI